MTYITSWEEFAKAAERLYLQDPSKVSLKALKFKLFRGDNMVIHEPWAYAEIEKKYYRSHWLEIQCCLIRKQMLIVLNSTAFL